MFLAGNANAADESVELSFEAGPISGNLFRETDRPIDARLRIQVKVPEGATRMTPMINSRVDFPEEITFDPDPKVTPPCPASKVGPQINLAQGVAGVVSICPRSVIGTGVATIKLAQLMSAELQDPQLVLFNAGRTSEGRPKITIYGYSKNAGSGLLMDGFLAPDGKLDIAIGTLPFDSAVSDFTIGIPGEALPVIPGTGPGGGDEVVGQDPTYLLARCSSGTWKANGEFSFATRNQSTGELTSSITELDSNEASLPCQGLKGKPVLAPMTIKKKGQKGSVRTFSVTVRNRGTATARSLKLKVTGDGRGNAGVGKIPAGLKRDVKVTVRLNQNVGRRAGLKFSLSGQGIRSSRSIVLRTNG